MITLTEVPTTPPNPPTVWGDILNLQNMVATPSTDTFKPQYTITGNKIDLRGMLYLPLHNGSSIDVTQPNSYLYEASATLDETRVCSIDNANFNNGTRQGRFLTTDVVNLKNLPTEAIPLQRDIVFTDVPAYRRYATGLGGILTMYRTFVTIRLCGVTTPFVNGGNNAVGCIAVFAPYNSEYDGSGSVPSGNDPQAFGISVADASSTVVDYINTLDNAPFNVPSGVTTSPFTINAHNIVDLGGMIINLNGLNGFIN